MIKKLCVLLLISYLFCGCDNSEKKSNVINEIKDLNNKEMVVGVAQGTAAMIWAENNFKNAKIQYFDSLATGYLSVQSKKIDAFLFDRHCMQYAVLTNPKLALMDQDVAKEHIVIALSNKNTELVKEVNAFIKQYREDGTYDDMYKRWILSTDHKKIDIPDPKNPTRTFIVGTEGLAEPLNYFGKDNVLTGFDIEFTKRLALFLNAKLEIKTMTYPSLIMGAETGKLDLVIANLNVTAERKEKMLLSDEYVDSSITAMIHKDRMPKKQEDKFLAGKKIGVVTGTTLENIAKEFFPKATTVHSTRFADLPMMLNYGKVDAFLAEYPFALMIVKEHKNLEIRENKITHDKYAFVFAKNNKSLEESFSKEILKLKANGEFDKLADKWFTGDESNFSMPKQLANPPKGTLKCVTIPEMPPFTFVHNHKIIGYDVELAQIVANKLGYNVEFIPIEFSGFLESIFSGKADLGAAAITITEERKEKVLFSEPTYNSGVVLVELKKSEKTKSPKLYTSIKQFDGKSFAYLAGAIFQQLTNPFVKNGKYITFHDNVSCVQAVLNKKVDGGIFDEPIAKLHAARYPNQLYVACVFIDDNYGFALPKNSYLTPKINKIIDQLDMSGELKKFKEKWINITPETEKLEVWTHNKNYTGKNGVLLMGTDPTQEPMAYLGRNHDFVGIDIEIANRVAYELDMKLEVVNMNFGSLIPALKTKKIDMAGASISITPSRKKSVDLTKPYYRGGVAVLARYPDKYEKQEKSSADKILEFAKTSRAGVMTGSYGEMIVDTIYKNKNFFSYDCFADGLPALINKKIDYIIGSYTSLLIFARDNKSLIVLENEMTKDGNAIAYKKADIKLQKQIDEVITKFQKDGTLKNIEKTWLVDFSYKMKSLPTNKNWPVLRVGIAADREPICFVQNGKYAGFDCDLIEQIAHELKMQVKYANMKFGSLIPALQAGKVDLVISNVTKTKERMQMVNFSKVYFNNPQKLLVHKDTYNKIYNNKTKETVAETFFWKNLKSSFRRTFIVEDRYKLILEGLKVTVIISLASLVFGVLIGVFICALRRSKRAILNVPAKIYIRLMQGTPMVVLLMILYYIVFGKIDINAIYVAIIGFSINFAAYAAEIMRTGVEAIDNGQIEAAKSMGFRKFQIFRIITFPQAARHAIPIMQGEFISMVKMTSVVGYIAIQDLTKMSDIIRSRTYEAFFPLIATALIYFVLAYLLTLILTFIERKIDPKSRKRIIRKVVTK